MAPARSQHVSRQSWIALALRSAAVGAVLIAASILAYRQGWFDSTRVATWAVNLRHHNNPIANSLLFVAVWGIATTLGFPGLPLMVAGGVLFGTIVGTLLSLAGTIVGALGGYALAQFVARETLRRWLHRRLPQLDLSDQSGFLVVIRLRLLPVLPISFGSYAAGLARVSLMPFIAGTLVGQIPSTLAYSYLGDRLLITARHGTSQLGTDIALISGALFVLTFLPWLVRRIANRR